MNSLCYVLVFVLVQYCTRVRFEPKFINKLKKIK